MDKYLIYDGSKELIGGVHKVYKFNNGFGASVISNVFSYGGLEGLYELAVLKFDGDKARIVYDTPITNDVIGWLKWEEVLEYLEKIKQLQYKELKINVSLNHEG